MKGKVPRGRPPEIVPQDIKEKIIEWISAGKMLRDFCRQDGAPAWRTVYDWLEKDSEFDTRFRRARMMGHDAIAEETLDIIDAEPRLITDAGAIRIDSAYVAWTKNRVQQRNDLLARWDPRRFGPRVRNEITGVDDGPVKIQTSVLDVSSLDSEQLAALEEALVKTLSVGNKG